MSSQSPKGYGFLTFSWTREIVTEGGDLKLRKYTNGVTCTNIGTTVALVNGFPINPSLVVGANGESTSIGGNRGEIIDDESIEITFQNAAGGRVFVQQKYYVDGLDNLNCNE